MALTREKKEQVVKDLKEKIENQKTTVFVAIDGLKADQIFDLRRKLKDQDCLLNVSKKTLMDMVLKDSKIDVSVDELEGQIAFIFGFSDEIAPAKIANNFSSDNENLKILGGIFENNYIDSEKVLALARIPSKEILLSKVVGSVKAPVSNFVGVLQGNIRSLLFVLSSIKK